MPCFGQDPAGAGAQGATRGLRPQPWAYTSPSPSFFLKKTFIYLFIYLAASGLSCGMQDLCCGMRDLLLRRLGFSLVVAQALENVGSVVAARA